MRGKHYTSGGFDWTDKNGNYTNEYFKGKKLKKGTRIVTFDPITGFSEREERCKLNKNT